MRTKDELRTLCSEIHFKRYKGKKAFRLTNANLLGKVANIEKYKLKKNKNTGKGRRYTAKDVVIYYMRQLFRESLEEKEPAYIKYIGELKVKYKRTSKTGKRVYTGKGMYFEKPSAFEDEEIPFVRLDTPLTFVLSKNISYNYARKFMRACLVDYLKFNNMYNPIEPDTIKIFK